MPSYDLIRHINRDYIDPDVLREAEEAARQRMEESRDDPDVMDNIQRELEYRAEQDNWASRAKESELMVDNVQFTQEELEKLGERGQMDVPLNYIMPAVQQGIAMMTFNKPKFQVTAREDSDRKTAGALSDLLTWIWDQSGGNQVLKQLCYDYYVKGRGVIQVYHDADADYGKGELKFMCIDPLEVFPDPNTRDPLWRDASDIIISRLLTRENIESIWPDAADIMYGASTDVDYQYGTDLRGTQGQTHRGDVDDVSHEHYRVIERYIKVKVPYTDVVENFSDEEFIFLEDDLKKYMAEEAVIVTEGRSQQIVNGKEMQPYLEAWEQGDETADPRVRVVEIPAQMTQQGEEIPARQIEIARVNNAVLEQLGQIETTNYLEDRIKYVITIGGNLYGKGYMPVTEYTTIPVMNRHNRTPYTMSDVEYVKPIQRAINKLMALMTANLATSTNVKAFVPRGSVDKEQVELDFAKAGAAILEYDPEFGAPVIAQPVPMSSATYSQLQLLIETIDRSFGIHPLAYGDSKAAPDTHLGTIEIEEFGQRRIRSKLDDIEFTLNHVANVLLQLIPHVYTHRKVIRIIEPNNLSTETTINGPLYDSYGQASEDILDVTVGKYDAVVVTGSTLPSNRWGRMRSYMELYEKNIIDQVEVLKKTDVVDAEGVLQRASIMTQMQQQLQAMDEEIKTLKGDLQTREREVYHAKLALEIEKGKSDINTQAAKTENRMEMAGQLYEKALDLELKQEKMKAAESARKTSTVKEA